MLFCTCINEHSHNHKMPWPSSHTMHDVEVRVSTLVCSEETDNLGKALAGDSVVEKNTG